MPDLPHRACSIGRRAADARLLIYFLSFPCSSLAGCLQRREHQLPDLEVTASPLWQVQLDCARTCGFTSGQACPSTDDRCGSEAKLSRSDGQCERTGGQLTR